MADHSALDGAAALVTGAASGIGLATTSALLSAGTSVLAFDADADGLERARTTWAAGDRVRAFVGDVADSSDVAAGFALAQEWGAPLRAVAACAGIHSEGLIEDLSDEEWRRVLRVNLRGTFLCCRAAARAMLPHQAGAMITMSSGLAYTGAYARAHYAASKAAVSSFTRSLALELAPHGIRANTLAPGVIDTPMPRKMPGRREEEIQERLGRNPLRRVGKAEDVANLILFLLSPASSHITGQVIHINGGELMP